MVLPHQRRFRIALSLARLARPATPLIDRIAFLKPIAAMLALAPQKVPQKPSDAPSPATAKRGRVAILQGCAEPVLRPEFREATVRLLNRRSEEHTSELQSLMRFSYAVFCLKKKTTHDQSVSTPHLR